MGKNKPRSKKQTQELLEDKTLVTVTIQFTVDTIIESSMSPDDFGNMVIKHIYKTLPYDERTCYDVDFDVWEEINK